ncbi:MAG: sugar phosphate isomerase/epimerase [Deltaproteobacteria bacterium]|nr:MAG: sugar phosphate isomerase/epimerase [Deltaproteobacteria bacterium]
MNWIKDKVQINIPFTMLWDTYIDRFIEKGLNPEVGLDATALIRFNRFDFSIMAERLQKRCLTITMHAPFVDLCAGSSDPDIRALTRHRFEQLLQLVPIFKPKTVVCHLGYDWKRYGFFKDEWIENSLEIWSWLGSHLQEEGSQLMLENVYEHGPDVMRVVLERHDDHNVGFCLDTGHQAAFSRTSLEAWLDSLGPFLGQLHLHDNRGRTDAHMAVGQGGIDFESFFKKLKTLRKNPPVVTLEPHKEGDLWPSFEYLQKLWPW